MKPAWMLDSWENVREILQCLEEGGGSIGGCFRQREHIEVRRIEKERIRMTNRC